MTAASYVYVGLIISVLWGVAHIEPVRPIVKSFGDISLESKRILVMAWLSEGFFLIFIGAVGAVTAWKGGDAGVFREYILALCGGALLITAVVTALTGGRTSIVPMRICPLVKICAAVVFFFGV